jgi:hypothetical protein
VAAKGGRFLEVREQTMKSSSSICTHAAGLVRQSVCALKASFRCCSRVVLTECCCHVVLTLR